VGAHHARHGREQLVVACNAALAAGKRITDDARRALAKAIAQAVEQADVPENRKERP
jgi:tripartite-type tricarboxylate transporter receptor subunit TctC